MSHHIMRLAAYFFLFFQVFYAYCQGVGNTFVCTQPDGTSEIRNFPCNQTNAQAAIDAQVRKAQLEQKIRNMQEFYQSQQFPTYGNQNQYQKPLQNELYDPAKKESRDYQNQLDKLSIRINYSVDYGEYIPEQIYETEDGENSADYERRIQKYFDDNATTAQKTLIFAKKTAWTAAQGAKDASSAVGRIFGYSDYCECIIEEMQEVQNDITAKAVKKDCNDNFSSLSCDSKKGDWFGLKNSDECISRYAKTISSQDGVKEVSNVCKKLYN